MAGGGRAPRDFGVAKLRAVGAIDFRRRPGVLFGYTGKEDDPAYEI